jgi:hypothetical protein
MGRGSAVGDVYSAYRVGVAVGSLRAAQEALVAALSNVLPALGYDHPYVVAIRRAQDAVRDARAEEGKTAWDTLEATAALNHSERAEPDTRKEPS